jgi:Tfp pilus assembly protein PilF
MISVSERAGDIRAAEVAARHILSIDPEDLCVPVELAIILEKQGRLSEARQLYQRIVAAPSVSAAYRAKALSEVERLTALEG